MNRDERPHVEAIVERATQALGPDVVAYDRGTVPGVDGNPGEQPELYAVVDVARRPGGAARAGGATPTTLWRCWIRIVGETANEVRWGNNRITQAFEDQAIEVGGRATSGFTWDDGDPADRDQGKFSGFTSWIYAH